MADPSGPCAVPCSTCPYLRSTPVGIWDIKEYNNLLQQDANPIFGKTFGCHKNDGTLCRGWLADQKRRGVPSIRLRIALSTQDDVGDQFLAVDEKNPDLYDSLEEMREANVDQCFPEDSDKARALRDRMKKR